MDPDRYERLNVGEKVLYHGEDEALYEGIVAERKELPGGAVVIAVLAPRGPKPSMDQLVYPGEGSLHALPFDGTEHCFHCSWHKLNWLAGERKHPFTGSADPD